MLTNALSPTRRGVLALDCRPDTRGMLQSGETRKGDHEGSGCSDAGAVISWVSETPCTRRTQRQR